MYSPYSRASATSYNRTSSTSTSSRNRPTPHFPSLWEKYHPIIVEDRKAINNPKLWNDAEHLYNQLKKAKG